MERFAVDHEREEVDFARRSAVVFTRTHSLDDELKWLNSEGPASEPLIRRVERSRGSFDFVLVFSVRYHQAYHCARAVADRVVLVPTAERDPALGLAMWFSRFFLAIPILAIAGSLAGKKIVPVSAGTLPTHTPLFVVLLASVVLIVGALTFLPALALGPIVEHLQMLSQ